MSSGGLVRGGVRGLFRVPSVACQNHGRAGAALLNCPGRAAERRLARPATEVEAGGQEGHRAGLVGQPSGAGAPEVPAASETIARERDCSTIAEGGRMPRACASARPRRRSATKRSPPERKARRPVSVDEQAEWIRKSSASRGLGRHRFIEARDRHRQFARPVAVSGRLIDHREEHLLGDIDAAGDAVLDPAEGLVEGPPRAAGETDDIGGGDSAPAEFMEDLRCGQDVSASSVGLDELARDAWASGPQATGCLGCHRRRR
jgi:hypothetical protein